MTNFKFSQAMILTLKKGADVTESIKEAIEFRQGTGQTFIHVVGVKDIMVKIWEDSTVESVLAELAAEGFKAN